VNVIGVNQVYDVLKPLYETKPATGLKVRDYLAAILNWATAKEYRTGVNPAAWSGPISTLLPDVSNRNVKHHSALPHQDIGTFMAGLRNFRPKNREGIEETEESLNALLLQFIILTAVRTGQAREARWKEFNLDTKIWTCPPERTKTGKRSKAAHVIYLSAPVLHILKTMEARQAADGTKGEYVFVYGQQDAPRMGQQMVGQPIMGDTHLIKFLQNTLGRRDLTVHGFRSTFKSWQVDHFPTYEIAGEMALDHAVGNEVRQIYARDATLVGQRRLLMDAWGEYCGRPEPLDAKVIPMQTAQRTAI
jgi:integrase